MRPRSAAVRSRRWRGALRGAAMVLLGLAGAHGAACVALLGIGDFEDVYPHDAAVGGSGAGGSTGGSGAGGCVADGPLLLVSGSHAKKELLDSGCFLGANVAEAGVHAVLVDADCGTCRGFLSWGTSQDDPLTSAAAVRWAEPGYVLGRYRGAPELAPVCVEAKWHGALASATGDSVFVARLGKGGDGKPCVQWATSLANETEGRSPHVNDLAAASGFVHVVGGLDGAGVEVVGDAADTKEEPYAIEACAAAFVLRLSDAGEHLAHWALGSPSDAGGGSGGSAGGCEGMGGGSAAGWDELAAHDSANAVVATDFGRMVVGAIRYDLDLTSDCATSCSPSAGCADAVVAGSPGSQKLASWQGITDHCARLDLFGADPTSGDHDQQLGYGLAYAGSPSACDVAVAGTAGAMDWGFGSDGSLPTASVPTRGDGFVARFTAAPCEDVIDLTEADRLAWAIRWHTVAQETAAPEVAVHRVALADDGAIVASAYVNDVMSTVTLHWDRSNGTEDTNDVIPPLELPPETGKGDPRGRLVVAKVDSNGEPVWRFALRPVADYYYGEDAAPFSVASNDLVVDSSGNAYVLATIRSAKDVAVDLDGCDIGGNGTYLIKVASAPAPGAGGAGGGGDGGSAVHAHCEWARRIAATPEQ